MTQDVLGIPVELSAPFDFSFLGRYGRPFCVFDQQQSGNICFGMQSERWGKLFVKFAGAPAVNAAVTPAQSIQTLRESVPKYEVLSTHPALVTLRGHGDVAGGYAAIFNWAEGVSLRPDKRFGNERYTHPESPVYRLHHQPLLTRLRMLDSVFDFHAYALRMGYVAVDFYDASLIADFNTGSVAICDIDLYRPLPAVNDMGRMQGSSRFMSPEEYEKGAPLDALTTQYNMGALAFSFLGLKGSRERAAWMAGGALYQVAARACSEDRTARYPDMESFLAAWRSTVSASTVY